MTREKQSCSFCVRPFDPGEEFVRGMTANICCECVTSCVGILSKSRKALPELVKGEAA